MKQLAEVADGLVARGANYEIVVASLRGLNEFRPEEQRVRSYLSNAATLDDPRSLRDALVLAMYVARARLHGATDIASDELQQWTTELADRLDDLLTSVTAPGYRCELLSIRAYQHLAGR